LCLQGSPESGEGVRLRVVRRCDDRNHSGCHGSGVLPSASHARYCW
jgi:hypothetical protein